MKRFWLHIAILYLALFSIYATSKLNLSTQVVGILPAANGGTGVATSAQGTVLSRSFGGGTGALGMNGFDTAFNNFVPKPSRRHWTYMPANSNGHDTIGDVLTLAGTNTNSAASTTDPPYQQRATTTTNGNVASALGGAYYLVGGTTTNLKLQAFARFSSTSTRRDWLGWTDQSAATMGASDNPAGNYAAFWYCNDSGTVCEKGGVSFDASTYWCVTKDGATQQLTNSLVTADTNWHRFEIRESAAGTFDFYVDSVLVATHSTNPPATNTILADVLTTTCVNCTPTTQNWRFGWFYNESGF